MRVLVAGGMCLLILLVCHSASSTPDIPANRKALIPVDTENGKPIVDEPRIKESPSGKDSDKGSGDGMADLFDAAPGSFLHGFIATLVVIIVSELGDKTFFIAAIMAMRHPKTTILAGAMGALGVMHVMSAFFGALALKVVPKVYTFYISSFLFAIFGLKMLKEGWNMSPEDSLEEMEEVQEELRKKEASEKDSLEMGGGGAVGSANRIKAILAVLFSPIFIQAFTMTFLAEWGDRSQLATIVLAAREDLSAIVIAGLIGHALCTGLAVMGGRFVATKISVRTVTLIGGVCFMLFAFTAFLMDPSEIQ